MAFPLPDPATEYGERVGRRLREEPVAWLTVVDSGGIPQPGVIWFLWDGESALIYSDHRAKRLHHLRAHPQAAMHLDSDGQGSDVVVLTGEISEVSDTPAVSDNPDYLAKYGARISNGPWGTPEVFAETYSVALRFRPHRMRGY